MKSILKSFFPWILFFALFGVSNSSQEIAIIAALIGHFTINRESIRKRFVLDVGSAIFFVLFALNLFVFHIASIADNGYLISTAVLALIAWVSLFIHKPFTIQYAKEMVTPEIAASPLFFRVNQILTILWSILFTAMIIPSVLHWSNTVNIVFSIILISAGVWITHVFPDWFSDKAIEKRFSIDIKKLFSEQHTAPHDFQNFQADIISQNVDIVADVVIVGAGPIGLASALLLQQYNISVVIIEKHPGVSIHPKARAISCRSMEFFRRLGVEKEILQYELPKSLHWFGWFVQLTGKVYARITKKIDYANISPTDESNVAQSFLEKVLLEKYQSLGGKIFFKYNVNDVCQNNTLVQVMAEDRKTQQKMRFQGQYLIAADGAHSTIRQLLSIPMIGPENINTVFSVYCEMNLDSVLDNEKRCGIAFTINSVKPSPMLLSIDGKNKWIVMFPSADISEATLKNMYNDEYTKAQIDELIGRSDIPVTFISKQVWSLSSQIANQNSCGRIFLAGDSMHRLVPAGGMGMNTGLQDVDNLIWKLALLMQKKINPAVLDTYSVERIPCVLNNMQWSMQNLRRIIEIRKEIENKDIDTVDFQSLAQKQDAHLNKSGLDLGAIYESNIISKTNRIKPIISTDQYTSFIYPGARLPHVEINCDGKVKSSLDYVCNVFLFLHNHADDELLLLIDFKSMPTNIMAMPELFQQFNLAKSCAICVRPDGHIAWVGDLNNADDVSELKKIISVMCF